MTDERLAFTPASDLLKLIATKQVSPVELTELYYRRIDRLNGKLNAYLFLTHDYAIERAKSTEAAIVRGDDLGLLHGLPISIKDTQMTAGFPSTLGSLVYKDRIPSNNSTVVDRLLASGAIMLGKTNVPEFGLVGLCENLFGEPGANPWDISRTPGGSSGGAASAMSASLCAISQGGDGGGSIRIPAHFSGIFGIKPTQGRVSGYSGLSGSPMPNLFTQAGPLSRTVEDAAIMLQVLAGYDPKDPTTMRNEVPDFVGALSNDISGLRIAWSPDFGFAHVDHEVLDVTYKAAKVFESLGCEVEESDLVLEEPYNDFGPLQAADCYATSGSYLETHKDQLTDFAIFFLEVGSRVTASEYSKALGLRDRLKAKMEQFFEKYDLLLSPTACFPALEHGQFPGELSGLSEYPDQYWNGAFTLPVNVIGNAAANVPAGFTSNRLPVGLQIVGRHGDEETVLAASAAFERVKPWVQNRPPVS